MAALAPSLASAVWAPIATIVGDEEGRRRRRCRRCVRFCPTASCWRRIIGNRRRWAIARRATRVVGIARGATVPPRRGNSPLRLARAATTFVLRRAGPAIAQPSPSANMSQGAATTRSSRRLQPLLASHASRMAVSARVMAQSSTTATATRATTQALSDVRARWAMDGVSVRARRRRVVVWVRDFEMSSSSILIHTFTFISLPIAHPLWPL